MVLKRWEQRANGSMFTFLDKRPHLTSFLNELGLSRTGDFPESSYLTLREVTSLSVETTLAQSKVQHLKSFCYCQLITAVRIVN